MANENEVKPKKPIWKKWWLWLIVVFVIIIIVSAGGEKKETQPTIQQSSTQKQIQKFSFEDYIQENLIKEYKIVEEEDISIKALGEKRLSDYSTEEITELPKNFRMSYSIVTHSDITLEELKSTLAQVIKEKSAANLDIDEIHVGAWESEESFKGGNPHIGSAEWSPYGEWAIMPPEIAKSNVRDSYKIVYSIDEKALEAIKKNKEETLFGLSEATRKDIFKESVECEYKGDREAMKYYFPGCETCSEFIVADTYKYADKSTDLIDSCREKVRKKYNITEEIRWKISIEALEKRWAMPEFLSSPECCGF